jgi:hypothetical protein
MSKKIEARSRKTSRQAAKTKIETVCCPDQDGAFRIEQVAHAEGAGQDADCTRWPDDAETICAHAPDYSSHVDAYCNAGLEQELASKPLRTNLPEDPPPPDGEYSPEELEDLRQALILLSGYQDRGDQDHPRLLPAKKYIKPSEEFAGRKAIARLLRSDKPVDRTILVRLAALFDPVQETEPFIECRRLIFRGRNGRPVTTDIAHLEVAIAYKTELDRQEAISSQGARERALNEIARKYPLEHRAIEGAWTTYKEIISKRR